MDGLPATAAPAARTPPSAWYALAVLVLTVIFAVLDRQILNLVVPSLQLTLRLSDMQLGLLQGFGLAIFAGVASYPIGWLADRYGRKLLLCLSILIWSLATAACAFQTSFTGLFLCTIGLSIGEAGLIPIVYGFLPDLFAARDRLTANVVVIGAGLLGSSITMGLSGLTLRWLTIHHPTLPMLPAGLEPWRLALLAVAMPAPLLILLVALLPTPAAGLRSVGPDGETAAARSFLPFLRAHWRTFICVFGAIAGYSLTSASAFSWLPLATFRAFGMQPADVGMQLAPFMVVGSILATVAPLILRRIRLGEAVGRPLRLARCAVLFALAPTILIATLPNPAQIFAGAALQYAAVMTAGAFMPGVVQEFSPAPLRSRILSLVTIVGALGQALSGLAIGSISGAIAAPRGVLIGLTFVGGFGLILCATLLTLAIRPFRATLQGNGLSSGLRT
jgi:MFS family permease